MQVHSLLALSACLSSVSALPWMSSLFAQTINYDPKSNQQDPATGSQQNNVGSPNRAVIPDWQTCQPNVDSCSTPGYICCVNAPDLWNNKATCRPPSDCKSMNNNPPISDVGGPCNQAIQNAAVCKPGLVCNPPAVAMPGALEHTCQQGRDSCASNGFVCCVAQADLWNNKLLVVLRMMFKRRLEQWCWNNGGNNNGNNGNNGGSNNAVTKSLTGKLVNLAAILPQQQLRATCRPKDQCGNTNGGNSNNGNNNGGSGKLVPMWENCGLTDTCANGLFAVPRRLILLVERPLVVHQMIVETLLGLLSAPKTTGCVELTARRCTNALHPK
ncbi:hypothetical protein BCR33DRAFT_785514 [Rhizoclosmatium globosum]|uniref:Hydrophobin n=1 Tax=Rhizoclosmatium globosum TaxID=329046 RepID=A0A1Y2C9I3_9FUNG|nr:hypothetical protein BCR33DRAFT_785514 [Rhizoclosmatium globosum]|eukprot:ORY43679.1 hypothetical protein BCR33DRAFT_785514 [Rhizoclosmatium globosum]